MAAKFAKRPLLGALILAFAALLFGLGNLWDFAVRSYQVPYTVEAINTKTGQRKPMASIHGSWLQDPEFFSRDVTYEITLGGDPKDLRGLSLVLPAFWGATRLYVDGVAAHPSEISRNQMTLGALWADKIFFIENTTYDHPIVIRVQTEGFPELAGFRGGNIYLCDDLGLTLFRLKNFCKNDIHLAYATLSIFVSLILLIMSKRFVEKRDPFANLIAASFAILPYHLMSTTFWVGFAVDPLFPQVVLICAEALAVPYFIGYSGFAGMGRTLSIYRFRVITAITLPVLAMLIVIGLTQPFLVFTKATSYWFYALTAFFIYTIHHLHKNKGRSIFAVLTGLLFVSNLYVDQVFGSNYLLGHGTFALAIYGIYEIVTSYFRSVDQREALFRFTSGFAPRSVLAMATQGIEAGMPDTEVLERMTGKAELTLVLVDICGYSRHMQQHGEEIMYQATRIVFQHAKKVFESHGLELFKETGDNVSFIGGLRSARRAAENCNDLLRGIIQLLNESSEISSQLRIAGLPNLAIKVAATQGEARYALHRIGERHQFDISGEQLILAKRIEDAMDVRFYGKYGYNVALVSTAVLNQADDRDLRRFFRLSYTLTDKHGWTHEAYILTASDCAAGVSPDPRRATGSSLRFLR